MQIRNTRNVETPSAIGLRDLPLNGVLRLMLFTSQLSAMGCGGRTMLDGLPTVGTGGGSTGTAEQNTGGVSMGGAVSGGASGSGSHPLWRKSSQPFCSSLGSSVGSLHVWSDVRGTFVLAGLDGPWTISTNTGSGWNTTYTASGSTVVAASGLKGFPNGPLVVYPADFRCPIEFIDGGVASCSGAQFVDDVAVVDSNLAYAVYEDRVLQFDGSFWTQLGGPLPGAGVVPPLPSVWADASTIVVVAGGGHVWVIPSGGDPVLQTGLPEGGFVAVWGFGASDIWIGSIKGQLYHYDGAAWSLKASIPGNCGSIHKLWGSDGSLFVLTQSLFGRWDGSGITTLSSLACDLTASFYDLWGNSPSEVFVVLEDRTHGIAGCGPAQVQWFNGSVVSPL
jgi:hypothetical protein